MTGRSVNSKQITVSNDTHSLLFIIEGRLQIERGARVGIDETIRILVHKYDSDMGNKLEAKE